MIQAFCPLITHSSPSRTAVVRIAAGSEPASGSDSAKAGDHSPLAHFGRKRCFLLARAEQLDRQGAELLDHQDQGGRGAGLGDLLDPDLQHQRAGAGAAVLLVEGEAEDVLLAEDLADVPGIFGVAVDVAGPRGDLLGRDLADRFAEIDHLLRDVVEPHPNLDFRHSASPHISASSIVGIQPIAVAPASKNDAAHRVNSAR